MKNLTTLGALALAVAFCGSMASAQAKIAYVNSEKILQELPEAQQAKKDVETAVKGWQDELTRMGNELKDAYDDYQKKKGVMDPKAQAEREKALQDMQQKAQEYQAQKFDTREGDAVKLREKKFQPIQDRVLDIIKTVATEDGYNYVFDKLDSGTNILFADQKFDLTYKVIDRLKRGAKPAARKN